MTNPTRYTVACLSGHGVGAEVMAEASRAFAHVARLHGFRIDEVHRPFGAEAFAQSGRSLPTETRRATLDAQAILVGAANEPALAGVESELDLRARVDRVVYAPRGAVTVVSPLGDAAPQWALERAFDIARSSRASVTAVGGDTDWRSLVKAEAAGHPGVLVELMPMNAAVSGLAFDPGRFDVVVTPAPFADPLVGLMAHSHRARVVASGRLARTGPSVFAPAHGAAEDIAGQGVANPASMLLAAALLLGEGLGERRAAETLSGAVLQACSDGLGTPDTVTTGVGATTREFADDVLSGLASALTSAEFYREAMA
ncbi:MAG: isocitrate/isopropylmalate family dehydrogenase [Gaiellaceae bacterium]